MRKHDVKCQKELVDEIQDQLLREGLPDEDRIYLREKFETEREKLHKMEAAWEKKANKARVYGKAYRNTLSSMGIHITPYGME